MATPFINHSDMRAVSNTSLATVQKVIGRRLSFVCLFDVMTNVLHTEHTAREVESGIYLKTISKN